MKTSIRARFAQHAVNTVAVAGILLSATTLNAQSRESRDESFSWTGTVGAGRTVIIKNINGPVRVERGTGNRVEISAEKRWRRGDPSEVRIVQPQTSNGDVLVCALWSRESTCDADGIHSPRNRDRDRDRNNNNDVSVHFVVRIPDGVRVDLNTVNGGVEVNGVSSEVIANTVNGTIEARSSGGPVRARTVNGSINVSMGSLSGANELEYETVNGSVTLEFPSNFGAQLELSTVNGRVNTDFPITVVGTLSPRKLRGTVGNGAARVSATTVNGSVTLRRSN